MKLRTNGLKIWSETGNFFKDFKSHRKAFFIGLAVMVLLVAIIFSLPLKTVTISETESYLATEIKSEPYTATEPLIIDRMVDREKVLIDGYYGVMPGGTSIPFYVDKPEAQIQGRFENIIPGSFNVTGIGNRIILERLADRGNVGLKLGEGWYQANFRENIMWGEQVYIYLAMKWTEKETTITYNTVTKYREVPVQVERQRVAQVAARVSLWKYIFN